MLQTFLGVYAHQRILNKLRIGLNTLSHNGVGLQVAGKNDAVIALKAAKQFLRSHFV